MALVLDEKLIKKIAKEMVDKWDEMDIEWAKAWGLFQEKVKAIVDDETPRRSFKPGDCYFEIKADVECKGTDGYTPDLSIFKKYENPAH